MNNDTVLIISAAVLVILFAGDPDLIGTIIYQMEECK